MNKREMVKEFNEAIEACANLHDLLVTSRDKIAVTDWRHSDIDLHMVNLVKKVDSPFTDLNNFLVKYDLA